MKVKLKQPDRSGPDPSRQTLLDIAEQRGLLKAQGDEEDEGSGGDGEPLIGRLGESMVWSISLTMLHFTLDVLVSHQFAVEIVWRDIVIRAAQAFPIILLLFYSFHPHATPSFLLPRLPPRMQPLLHQIFFFLGAVSAGSYLIHITNKHGYYAVMKQSPPVGCLWIWSVIELNVFWATGSLMCCGIFLKLGGYSFL